MELLKRRAYARAGLLGNPSDGFHGKTLSLIVRDYFAEVVVLSTRHTGLQSDHLSRSLAHLAAHVAHGQYLGFRQWQK